MHNRIREIPYNYTSFSDKEIVIRFLGVSVWNILNRLRLKRRTGISARLLFDILGDMWIIKRNPYIQDDLLNNKKRRDKVYQSFDRKLQKIISRADDNSDMAQLIAATKKTIVAFQSWLESEQQRNKKVFGSLKKYTNSTNIYLDGLSKVSHVTDASDWRVEYPRVVVSPKNETEMKNIVRACMRLKLNIVPRGGGTGYTGGAIPMVPETAVINTEKLDFIDKIIHQKIKGIKNPVPTITMGAGTITKEVSNIAKKNNLIFAVDPTSEDSSTIGGNIATNAGGKKAVMWGTTLDNLLSWKMIMSRENDNVVWVKITRENHNLGKIHDLKVAIFKVQKFQNNQQISEHQINLTAAEARKPGLGKDVTNKILGKLPGVQKEGCDGLITSATFVLHQKFTHKHTVCLEFFNPDMRQSVSAINILIEFIKTQKAVHLTGLEHLDARYIKAVGYSSKSATNQLPKMLLIADISSEDERILSETIAAVIELVRPKLAEAFVATDEITQQQFWADRKKTAAIATHTNAFKINEDVVIPLDKLADYTSYIETINIKQSMINKLNIIESYQSIIKETLAELDTKNAVDKIYFNKLTSLNNHLKSVFVEWKTLLDNFATKQSMLAEIKIHQKIISLRVSVQSKIDEILTGDKWQELYKKLTKTHQKIRTSRIFVATHMHAGDGNIHTNIPVHSNDYEMLRRADQVVDEIMKIAVDLGGVISGEHGIGLTKIKYLHRENIKDFISYKKLVDKNNHFNRGKLTDTEALNNAYTPSLRLLEMEALILEESELGELNHSIKDCLRCGKCKPVCATHIPRANLFYSPRNKILAVGLLTEAFLYEEQTRRGISLKHFEQLNDIADHCTVCHKCLNPCPVDIDFGDVTILIRQLLNKQGKRKFNLGSKVGLFFLNISDVRTVNLARNLMIRFGYSAQRLISQFIKTPKKLPNTINNTSVQTQIVQFLKNPMPKDIPSKTMRNLLNIEDKNIIPIIRNPAICDDNSETVFYFPGCGSERLFSQIGLGVLRWLYEIGVQTIVPPQFLCCGYPQRANGNTQKAHTISTDNRVLFHRIAKNLNHLTITKIVVSCGTCLDQMLTYEMKQIFPDAQIIDIHELLLEKKISVSTGNDYLFHEPCHTPTKKYDAISLSQDLLKTKVSLSERCCGESGTFAIARADIASQVKSLKVEKLNQEKHQLTAKNKIILTTCPACLQGLNRLENETNVSADYPILVMAKQQFGKNWVDDFVKKIADDGIERVLL